MYFSVVKQKITALTLYFNAVKTVNHSTDLVHINDPRLHKFQEVGEKIAFP
jgi:hypothetical protein